MQSRGSYGFKNNLNASSVYIYYMYTVCTRVKPAIFEKREDSRRGSRGGGGCCVPEGIRTPLLKLSKYTSQRTTFQDFRCYQGVTLLKLFSSLRSPVITSSSNESHFMCQMVYFYAKTNQFYSIFSWGGPQTPPLLLIFHSVLTVCWEKKEEIKRYKQLEPQGALIAHLRTKSTSVIS